MISSRATQSRVYPWCPESATKTFTMNALKKHVARKHPDTKLNQLLKTKLKLSQNDCGVIATTIKDIASSYTSWRRLKFWYKMQNRIPQRSFKIEIFAHLFTYVHEPGP
ncbi:hypothetical protein BD770DRAFT_411376 [Pilaira anomala]|nr:hypothetical protein BD770DRAFT_411376 [Pilaira anomala]